MKIHGHLWALLLLLAALRCQAAVPQQPVNVSSQGGAADDASFVCGTPLAPCGGAIPAGARCPNGPGYCQPGHFCGTENSVLDPPRCLPLPKGAGTAGHPCLPSNADRPHTSVQDKHSRKPHCTDGSTCFYAMTPMAGANQGDIFAGNQGIGPCTPVAPDCGLKEGSPCCPYPYMVAANPPLPRVGCATAPATFCAFHPPPSRPGRIGTCRANAPDCGALSKACCVLTGAAGTARLCGADRPVAVGALRPPQGPPAAPVRTAAAAPAKSYCKTGGAPASNTQVEGVCTACPAQPVDAAALQKNPDLAPCVAPPTSAVWG